jgi:hypothetical protein
MNEGGRDKGDRAEASPSMMRRRQTTVSSDGGLLEPRPRETASPGGGGYEPRPRGMMSLGRGWLQTQATTDDEPQWRATVGSQEEMATRAAACDILEPPYVS